MPARFGFVVTALWRSLVRRADGPRITYFRPTHLGPPGRLALWVALQVLVATVVIVVVVAGITLDEAIGTPFTGMARGDAPAIGLSFWLIFGLVGGLRAHARPGGSVMTFSLPFIVAGTILGGPVAGALMGLVSEFEVRELRTLPWYGTLANHAVSIIAAVSAALLGGIAGTILRILLPNQEAPVFFVVAMITAFTFATINVLLVVPTLSFKGDVSLAEAARSYDASFRTTSLAEGILAWLMATTYVSLGWWAPVACIALVLIVWQAHDRSEALRHDEKTGLLNDSGFMPLLTAALEHAHSGRRASAYLLLDLDRFKAVNDTWLHEAGDEVLRVTARRLMATVRMSDSVARMNRAGDEFAVLLDGVDDLEMAVKLAARIQARLREPIHLRSRDAVVDVDSSIGVVQLARHTNLMPADVARIADVRMNRGKSVGSGIIAEGDDDDAALAERAGRKPTRV
ncbi:MAG: GGDEF domain-containing protein [Chloroflexota bacterium]